MNIYHKITWGDSLLKVSERFELDVDTLCEINDCDVYIGKVLKITNHQFDATFTQVEQLTLEYCLERQKNKRRHYRFL